MPAEQLCAAIPNSFKILNLSVSHENLGNLLTSISFSAALKVADSSSAASSMKCLRSLAVCPIDMKWDEDLPTAWSAEEVWMLPGAQYRDCPSRFSDVIPVRTPDTRWPPRVGWPPTEYNNNLHHGTQTCSLCRHQAHATLCCNEVSADVHNLDCNASVKNPSCNHLASMPGRNPFCDAYCS